MRAFDSYNPIVIFVYFLTVTVIAMFAFNPVMILITLFSEVVTTLLLRREKSGRFFGYLVLIFLITSLANPVFSHNGVTVLFLLNDNPVTLEAVLYGVSMGTLIIAVLLLMRVFSGMMTGDKILYIMGTTSPKLALLISMNLRFIPMFSRQAKKMEQTQTALGRYQDENALDDIAIKMNIFSMLITWGLENGIITADSMSARGYGSGRRTNYSNYRFRKNDAFILIGIVLIAAVTIGLIAADKVNYSFYPHMSGIPHSAGAVICYILYGLMCLFPVVNEIGVRIKWRYLESRI